MKRPCVLVVEDEGNILHLVRSYLEREGYGVATAEDGPSGLRKAQELKPDLVILDLMLPGLDGVEVCRQLRSNSQVPVLMLTAKAQEADKLVGFAVGADDYLTKPFSPREMVARARALLRRAAPARPGAAEGVIRHRDIVIDPISRTVTKGGSPVHLTALEFDLLYLLAQHPGKVFRRQELLRACWAYDYCGDEHVVDVHISNLRKKLGEDTHAPAYIATVRGVGYRFGG